MNKGTWTLPCSMTFYNGMYPQTYCPPLTSLTLEVVQSQKGESIFGHVWVRLRRGAGAKSYVKIAGIS